MNKENTKTEKKPKIKKAKRSFSVDVNKFNSKKG